MFIKILKFLVLILIIFAATVATQPSDFKISRSTLINAPASSIYNQINNLKNWNAWSPWAKIDPEATATFSGTEAGVGSAMTWSSKNPEVGVGTMTITENKQDELVKMRLDFQEPFQASNAAEFNLITQGDKTEVSWSMTGTNNFIGKAMSLIFNCDKMVGGKFEEGLNNLKNIAEKK